MSGINEAIMERTLEKFEQKIKDHKLNGEALAPRGTVEIIDWHEDFDPRKPMFKFDDAFETNREFVELQTKWYESMNTSIRGSGLEEYLTWDHVKSNNGETNSNYGWCVFGPKNGDGVNSQFDYAIASLVKNEGSRQAVIFYNRPSMHWEWNSGGMRDFTCTLDSHLMIRNMQLRYIVHQRSCDLFNGFFYDFYHHSKVYEKAINVLRETYPNLIYHAINYCVDSLHVYEKDFDKVLAILHRRDSLI